MYSSARISLSGTVHCGLHLDKLALSTEYGAGKRGLRRHAESYIPPSKTYHYDCCLEAEIGK